MLFWNEIAKRLQRERTATVMRTHTFVYPVTQEVSVPYTTRPGRVGSYTDEDTW